MYSAGAPEPRFVDSQSVVLSYCLPVAVGAGCQCDAPGREGDQHRDIVLYAVQLSGFPGSEGTAVAGGVGVGALVGRFFHASAFALM